MLSIGDFARLGQVSVRMLRHYDAIGLLQPAHVDGATGYRYYEFTQLARLNRVIALKDLGFTLQQVQDIVADSVSATELRGMLRLRRSQLEQQIAADAVRLRHIEVRLRTIESEGAMSTNDVVIKSVSAVRVAELTGHAAGFDPRSISPVIQPLFEELSDQLATAAVEFAGPAIAYYEETADGVIVHAAVPVNIELGGEHPFAVVDLPRVDQAATLIHRGSMDEVLPDWQALGRWVDENGYSSTGFAREVTLEYTPDPTGWVTELQIPVSSAR